jgi:tight adherence protein B
MTALAQISPQFWAAVTLITLFAAVVLLTYGIVQFLSRGWKSYEEKYVVGATRTLDAMYLTMTPQQVLYLSLLSTLVVGLLVGVTTMNPILGILLGAAAFITPTLVIRFLKWRRDKKFDVQLVDALLAMGNGLRAGYSLPAAFDLLAREMENPMGQEMRLLSQEMRLGVSMDDALRHLHERMPGEALDILITSVLISREVGGNLAEVFDNIADTIRERHRIEGKIGSLTAQGKLQAAVIALLPPVIFVALNAWSPDLIRPMYQDWRGLGLIGLIVLMEGVGILMIRRIVSIRV